MVTSLHDVSNTKENYASIGAVPQPTNRSIRNTFGTARANANVTDKKKRADTKANKDQNPSSSVEPVEMNQAFDQLLVSGNRLLREEVFSLLHLSGRPPNSARA